MKLEEILSFLEDEVKRNSLIYKLKHAGENSKQAHALKQIITSFHLHKTPKEIFQTNILQNTFRYCDPKECFTQFRLVCKTWKHAVESIRYERGLHLEELTGFVQNVAIRNSYPKYMKMFKNVEMLINEEFVSKWDILATFLGEHLKRVNDMWIGSDLDTIPPNFNLFITKLLKNSQTTLQYLGFNTHQFVMINLILLPNLLKFEIELNSIFDNQIPKFDKLVKKVLSNCENLQNFMIRALPDQCPNIMQHLKENYAKHCICSHTTDIPNALPLKMIFKIELTELQAIEYPSMVEYLSLGINANSPNEDGWENYKTILSLFPNVKGIRLVTEDEEEFYEIDWQDVLQEISEENKNIWEERISYLESKGIALMNEKQYDLKFQELCKPIQWGFDFYLS